MKTLRITHLLENDTRYLDQINVDCDGKPLTSEWPWYNATGDGAFFHGTNELASVSEEWEIQDTPWVSLANGQFSAETINDWLPTETNIRWNFELNIAARTRDNHVRSDEKDNFTEFAQGTWRWDGDAKHAAGKWAANDAEVSILAPLAASKDAGKLVEDWSLKDGDKSHQPFNKYIHPWSKFNEHDLEIL